MTTKTVSENLVPFTSETAKEAGRKGGLARARNAAARKTVERGDGKSWATELATLQEQFNREDIGANAAAVAQMILGKLATGELEINSRDVSSLLDTLVSIVRLEEGKATSHTATVTMEGGVLERIEALRTRHVETTATDPEELNP